MELANNLKGLHGLALYIYMDLHDRPPSHPIKSRVFENKYNAKGTEIRDAIRQLRVNYKLPICSGSTGYYFARNKAMWERTKAQLLSRAKKLREAASNPDEYFYDGEQSKLF